MKKPVSLLAGTALLLSLVIGTALAGETVRIHGSTTVQKRIMEPGKEAFEKATGITLALVGNGTGSGLEDLVKGKCEAAMASEELDDAVSSMKAASGTEPPAGLKANVITSDVIKVIINNDNPVTKLDKEQLKGLNTGKIANWKEVGGPDLAVMVITSHAGSATRRVFQKVIMDGQPYVTGAIEVETTRKEIENVMNFPEGIGAVSAGFVNLPEYKGKAKVAETKEASRPLMLITKGEPSPNVKKVLDFFNGEGKKYIRD